LRSARNSKATRKFRDELDKKFEPLESDWNLTEKALMESAVKCFPTLREPRFDTWLTPDDTVELGPLIKQSSECCRLLSRGLGDVPQLLNQKRSVKKAVKLCVVTHKKIFRQKLATIAS
jgi:hypothetical protein